MKKSILLIILGVAILFISGCLTCEKKEFTFKLTGPNSGSLTIKYYNLMSTMDDTVDISEEDFMDLVNNYYVGSNIENDFPETRMVDKRLFEEDGVLCGEIVLEFDSLSMARLYRFKDEGPFMYCVSCGGETEAFEYSDGEYGGDIMPVVFWDRKQKELHLTTRVTEPDETTISLLDHYTQWKEMQPVK